MDRGQTGQDLHLLQQNQAIDALPPGFLATLALGEHSPGLPGGVWRDDCLEVAIIALRGALTPATEQVLRFYVRKTRPADWTEPGRGPVAYVSQRSVAEYLGIDRRSVHRAECDLERLGLIAKLAADNGRRYGPQGDGTVACGIYFAPMIQNYAELATASAEIAANRDRLDALRKLASSQRFQLRRLAGVFSETAQAAAALATLDTLPSQIMSMTDMEKLIEIITICAPHVEALNALKLSRTATDHPQGGMKPAKMSHKGDSDVPRQRNSTNNPHVVCNREAEKKTPAIAPDESKGIKGTSAHADVLLRIERGEGQGREKIEPKALNRNVETETKGKSWNDIPAQDLLIKFKERNHKPKSQMKMFDKAPDHEKQRKSTPAPKASKVAWSLKQLFDAASVEFQAVMDANAFGTENYTQCDFIDAAETTALAFGINQSAWQEACDVMGKNEAALAMMVIDKNRKHPTHPVQNPGGALRAMTERAKKGQLNLDASIFAILKRKQNENIN